MDTLTQTSTQIDASDLAIIKKAKYDLEHVSVFMKTLNNIGTPIDGGLAMVPEKYQHKIKETIQKVLQVAVKANLQTMDSSNQGKAASNGMFKLVSGISGAAGGFLGVAGFTADLLLSTKMMMRTILDIARSEGEDVHQVETQLACLEVFALGGTSEDDDELDTSYYATRAALHTAMNRANSYILQNGTARIIEGLASQVAPPLAKVINLVAARYTVQVSEKFAAQLLPVVGAAAGASINVVFISHFQKMATAHFVLRRLERKYNRELIRKSYEQIVA